MNPSFIRVSELAERLAERPAGPPDPGNSKPLLVDCRFRLTDPDWGKRAFVQGHARSAVYAHLDQDLSDLSAGPGRHPLPDMPAFRRRLSHWGVAPGRKVVVYDDAGGAIAARLWWMLRCAGHSDSLILEGGWDAWLQADLPIEIGSGSPMSAPVQEGSEVMPWIETQQLKHRLNQGDGLLLDARAEQRFRGESEPIDRVAGRIPGARNWPFENNLRDGLLRPRSELESDWREITRGMSPKDVIHMCGSGVTACFNIACMEHLGMTGSILYVASFSGWIGNADNPIATGP